ncbi:hypothetical protein G7Y89_g2186 [Cudoniella acicularis]|uniref:RRM domain-containing protein n=1 Tax=Cudoniella acicularis TaxID=354080 RepID=A0A8H4W8V1_9HELO|nr:hypothetical protein G7Y89_g2186 [Cudoniella acicularis]
MQRSRNLPTERGHAPVHIPQYIVNEGFQSTDSTGSQDSVMTQVPLPYHLPTDGYSQDYSYSSQIDANSPWATPILPSSGGFESFPNSSKALNPNSSPYVPGYPSPMSSHFPDQQWQGDSAMAQQYQQQPSQMSMAQYQVGNQYEQANTPLGGPIGSLGSQLPNPYGAPPNVSYQPYERTVWSWNWKRLAPPSQGPLAWGSQYTGAGLGRYPHPYSTNPNANRGLRVNANGKHIGALGAPGNEHKSNLSTAPVRNINSPNPKTSSSTLALGGPVQPPSKLLRPSSRAESVGQTSTGASSTETRSRASEDINRGPTPSTQPRPLDIEFSSEPRKFEPRQTAEATPQLRSRRKQSSASLSNDVRRDGTGWFTESTINENVMTEDATMRRSNRSSPPKMLSLLAVGGVDASTLSPITETDHHSVAPLRPTYNDPFGPAPSMTTPYNGSTLLTPPHNMSIALSNLTNAGKSKPSIEEALDARNLPFCEYCRTAKEDMWGVIKIKNIPYSVARSEVMAFLGRNARIISENDHEPIHIMMERVTSKTLDCYVEFVSFNEAVNAVNRFETNRTGGRGGRLGQRHVEVELSSQEALMKDLFPKAKNVVWHGGRPEIIPRDENDMYNSGFQGFVSKEELVMLVKHVEAPQRSPFSKDCPQRPFECLISTLLKYPWYMVDYITIEDRNLLHKATKDLVALLVERVNDEKDSMNLTHMLLKRVWRAVLKCPGFTPSMKDDIVYICGVDERIAMEQGLALHASYWKYLWTISPKPGVPGDLLMWYAAIIREATVKKEVLSLAEQAARGEVSNEEKLFGDLDKHIQYGPGLLHQSLSQVAKAEWAAIEKILRQVLTPAIEG